MKKPFKFIFKKLYINTKNTYPHTEENAQEELVSYFKTQEILMRPFDYESKPLETLKTWVLALTWIWY